MKKKYISIIVLLSVFSTALTSIAKENSSVTGELFYLSNNAKNLKLAETIQDVKIDNPTVINETSTEHPENINPVEEVYGTSLQSVADDKQDISNEESSVYVNSVEETNVPASEPEDLTKKTPKIKVFDNLKLKAANMKSLFKLNKNKTTKNEKIVREKGTFTDFKKTANVKNIEDEISSEEIFQRTTNNKIYLNRFKAFDSEDKDATFYDLKNIVETEDGDLQLLLSDGKEIDKLIEEIENSDSETAAIELSLRDCIAIALAKHPDIMSAKLDTDISKSRIIQAWAGYFPNFSAGFNYGYDYMKEPSYKYHYNSAYFPTVSAGMLLFDFGKVKTDVDMATSSYDATRYSLQDSINVIIYSVKSAYYNMLFAQKQVDIYEKTIEDFELQLKSAKKYFSIGKKPQIEVAMAEYNEGNARLNLVKARNALENAKVLLANTLGLPEFANFELVTKLENHDSSADLEKFLADAFSIRPDLLAYEKNVEYAYLALRRARRNFAPDLLGNGGMTHGGADPMKSTTYRVSVDLSYSGFNLLQLKKEYEIAQKSYEKSLLDYESFRHNVYLEVKQAYIDLINSKESVEQADMNIKQAKAQHYHATGRYNAGVSDAIEMKDAENTYLGAQLEYYQALLDYNLAIANLEKVVGRPVEIEEKSL